MAISFGVEMLNIIMRKSMQKNRVVELNEPVLTNEEEESSDEAK